MWAQLKLQYGAAHEMPEGRSTQTTEKAEGKGGSIQQRMAGNEIAEKRDHRPPAGCCHGRSAHKQYAAGGRWTQEQCMGRRLEDWRKAANGWTKEYNSSKRWVTPWKKCFDAGAPSIIGIRKQQHKGEWYTACA